MTKYFFGFLDDFGWIHAHSFKSPFGILEKIGALRKGKILIVL